MRVSLPILFLALASCSDEAADTSDLFWADDVDAHVELDLPIARDAAYHPTRVLVGFDGPDIPASLDGFGGRLANRSLTRLQAVKLARTGVYELPAGVDVVDAVEDLRATGRFRFAEPDYERTISAAVDDPYRTYQWHFDAIDAETAWDYSTGVGAIVAVIDTGVTSGPSDGIANLLTGYDFHNSDSNAADDNGHGTHVAGTINQESNNAAGVAGLAYGASILPVKVLGSTGSGYSSSVISGIDYAVAYGVDVINMSLGSTSSSSAEATAVYNAYAAGVFVAAASGNSGASSVEYPGAYSGAVAVGATRYGNALASYSTKGSALDLVAPGGDTSRDDNGDGYADGVLQETFSGTTWSYYFFQGTSMATPHVAAAAALLMANGATNVEAETYLKDYATDLGTSGFDTSYGYGLIQPAAALAAWGGGSTNVPPVAEANGPYSGTTGTAISFSGTGSTDSDGTISSYAWNFGDGSTGTGESASHSYTTAGTFTVTLTVTDNSGATHSDTATATVTAGACTVAFSTLSWNSSKRKLTTYASSTDTTATLYLYADGTYFASMTYNSRKGRYQNTTTLASKPTTVSMTSTCGGTASQTL
jgi:serine protease